MRSARLLGLVLVAACGKPAPHRARATDPKGADEPRAEAFVVANVHAQNILFRDGDFLYWVDFKGVFRRPLGGPDAGAIEQLSDDVASLADLTAADVAGGVVAITDGAALYVLRPGKAELEILAQEIGAITDVAVGEREIAIARADAILKVPIGGGDVVELAGGQTEVAGIAIDGDHVYWTEYGEDRANPYSYDETVPGPGAVRRVPIAGGKVKQLAGGQRGPRGIVVHDGRVWWCNDRAPALQSARVDGGNVRTELHGAADSLSVDDLGAIVHNPGGYVLERRHDGTSYLRMSGDGTWFPDGGPPVSDPAWVYGTASRADGAAAVLAVPRDDAAPTLSIRIEGPVSRARAHDGQLYWLESKRDGSGLELWRGKPETGVRTRLTDHYGWPTDFAVGGGEIYITEDAYVYRVSKKGGAMQQVAVAESYITAITVHRGHVFWVDGTALMARKKKGGEAFAVARTGYGYGGGDAGGDIVFDDDYAYLTNFGPSASGVFRIDEAGKVEMLWDGAQAYPGRDLVRIGDDLFFWTSGPAGVFRLPRDEDASLLARLGNHGDGYINDMIEAAGLLYVSVGYADHMEIARIDPETGDVRAVLRWAIGDSVQLAGDESGVYVAIDQLGGFVRIPHDAPALSDWK